MSNNIPESTEVAPDDAAWELEGTEGEQLDPNEPDVLAARRAAGDETAPPEEVGA